MKTAGSTIPVHRDGELCYQIIIRPDFEDLSAQVKALHTENRRLCVVTDSQVESLYGAAVMEALRPVCREVTVFSFSAGEESKTLDTVRALYEHLILNHFDRKDMLVALGGGVVGDLTGYGAATYLRGIDFIQLPTTLLSQVDSSIGGKTGVDFDSYKNMVGAFHMPRLVYMNLGVLETLSDRQFACGMAEILKHGLIKDISYFQWLMAHRKEIWQRRYEMLLPMIEKSCRIKGAVVEQDPTEQEERALLNFGHTIGHAVEKLMEFKMLHGECVAVGMAAAVRLSVLRGLLEEKEEEQICSALKAYQLPVSVTGLKASEILAATKSDKKMEAGSIKFVLLKQLGSAAVDRSVTDEELLLAIAAINQTGDTEHE